MRVWLSALLLALPLASHAESLVVLAGEEGNLVTFESKAPTESITGKTKQISGTITFDPAPLGDSISVSFEVDAASLDTGIGLRNQHMRENHLHTKQYPKIRFRGARVLEGGPDSLAAGRAVTVQLEGTFSLHGVERRVTVPVEVVWDPVSHLLRAVARFQVKLADYGVPRPQFLVMRLDETQRITVQVTARPAP